MLIPSFWGGVHYEIIAYDEPDDPISTSQGHAEEMSGLYRIHQAFNKTEEEFDARIRRRNRRTRSRHDAILRKEMKKTT